VALEQAGTVSVNDGTGLQIWSGDGTLDGSDDRISCSIPPSALPGLDLYTVTWRGTPEDGDELSWATTMELVGGFHFSIATLAGARKEFAAMSPDALRDARTLAEVRFESECRVSFVPRGARETVEGDGSDVLLLGHVACRELLAISEDG